MDLKFLLGAGLMLASGIALTGCSSDLTPDNPDTVLEAGTKFYMRVALANPGAGTRTADVPGAGENTDGTNYTDGTTDENEVKDILFVFYNAEGEYVAHKTMGQQTLSTTVGGNIEALVNIIVPITLQEAAKIPAYVVAYVNPTTKSAENVKGDLNAIQANYRTLAEILPAKFDGTNTNGFLMTNSVYYVDGANAPVVATPIPPATLYETEKAANEGTATITIYVERAAAKVTVSRNLTNGTQTDITDNMQEVTSPDGKTYKLDFKELAWGFNNEEKKTFVLKNFRNTKENNPTSVTQVTNMSYAEANTEFATLTQPGWNYGELANANEGRRTFWAYSPTYFFEDGLYPEYADQYDGNEGKYDGNEGKYPLIQTSFNDIYSTTTKEIGAKGYDFGASGYTLENTVSANTLRAAKAGPRAVTTALVVGKYRVLDNNNQEVTYDNLYIRRNIPANSNTLYVGNDFMMQSFLATQTREDGVIFKDNGENASPRYTPVSWAADNMETIKNDFEIVYPDRSITGPYTASRYITLQLKASANLTVNDAPAYYYLDANGLMTAVKPENIAAVNVRLYQFFNAKLGAVEEFAGGYAYFAVPVRHLWGRDLKGFEDPNAPENGFTLGQYGIVRNHVYNINVQAISGIGTGLSDPEDPIVVPVKDKQYFVKTQIRVQKWRIVPQQDVDLK